MAKHFMIYYQKGTGTYIITEPRPWSRENTHLFPNYDFIDNHPTTDVIEHLLINNYNFLITEYNNYQIVVLQNLDPGLEFI